jgi:NADP-dependent 3-hydroxy acid dehydrogenase YdfG
MKLKNKNAIIYGGGGSLGSAVACAFAHEGATIFLAGRNMNSLQKVKVGIIKAGGRADAVQVDALNKESVSAHINDVVDRYGTIDISFNLIGFEVKQNIPLCDMQANDFVDPITAAMTTHFLTATAAANIMVKQHSGIILSLSSTPGGIGYPLVGAGDLFALPLKAFQEIWHQK